MAKVVKAQQIPQKIIEAQDILASFCYNFPQYTYSQARQLPFKRVQQMMKAAEKDHAQKMIELAHIMSAAMSGKGMRKVLSSFKKILED